MASIMPFTRRQFCAAATAPLAAASARPRPNILWITSEDNGPFLGCYGDPYANTPNFDRMAAQGTLYENAFSAFPVCAPTRSTLITGVCANSAGTGHMRSFAPLPNVIRMFPELLRQAGYHCTNNSKEDYNTKTPAGVWDQSNTKATWRNRKPGQPFFHVVNFGTTHESSMFKPRELVHDPKLAKIPPYHPDNEVFRRDRAHYYDNITRLDEQAGKVLADLEADGLAEDTIVFYFSDHGGIFPRGKRFVYDSGTRVPLLIRFPEKFRHLTPVRPGGRTDRLVGFVDFAPSILSLAGVPVPGFMQGKAFLGEQAAAPRDHVFSARDRMGPCPDLSRAVRDKRFRYIRNYHPQLPAFQYDSYAMGIPCWADIWKLHREGSLNPLQDRIFQPKPPEELYDTQKDPHEIENLAGRPEFAKVLAKMRAECDGWLREIRDVSFAPELEMHRLAAGSTPYDLARDPERYPLDRILRLAAMAGAGRAADLPEFVKHLGGENTVLQYWAAIGCRVLDAKAKPAREALASAMRKSPSPSVRMAAAEVLCRLGEPAGALAVLETYLGDEEPWTRMHAAVTLGWLGERARTAIPALKKLTHDKERYPSLAAGNALLNIT
jgi:arylsulfatase A-like enzyme